MRLWLEKTLLNKHCLFVYFINNTLFMHKKERKFRSFSFHPNPSIRLLLAFRPGLCGILSRLLVASGLRFGFFLFD